MKRSERKKPELSTLFIGLIDPSDAEVLQGMVISLKELHELLVTALDMISFYMVLSENTVFRPDRYTPVSTVVRTL